MQAHANVHMCVKGVVGGVYVCIVDRGGTQTHVHVYVRTCILCTYMAGKLHGGIYVHMCMTVYLQDIYMYMYVRMCE